MSELSKLATLSVSTCTSSNRVEFREISDRAGAKLSSRLGGDVAVCTRDAVVATSPAIVPPVVMTSSFLVLLCDIDRPLYAGSRPHDLRITRGAQRAATRSEAQHARLLTGAQDSSGLTMHRYSYVADLRREVG
jgi:hypothetical protein